MDILGVGPLEIVLVLIIALIFLGPNEMIKVSKTIGRYLRKLVTSKEWRTLQQTSKEIHNLPNKLMREAGIEELKEMEKDLKEINPYSIKQDINNTLSQEAKEIEEGISAWTSPSSPSSREEQMVSTEEKQEKTEEKTENQTET